MATVESDTNVVNNCVRPANELAPGRRRGRQTDEFREIWEVRLYSLAAGLAEATFAEKKEKNWKIFRPPAKRATSGF